MRKVIFIGPTLSVDTVKGIVPDALIMPPAEQGDIDFARYQLGADIIALVDGTHTQTLPVLHKEILSVLQDGCRVMGAASMGALRAVECEPFGAEPYGEVARMYQEGEIDADDEVCLVHADHSQGYKHLSIPLVNIRATLNNAIIEEEKRKEILEYARALFYADREWQNIFEACDVDDNTARSIQESFVDIKEADALHLCYTLERSIANKPYAERQIFNAHYGFAAVFENNDRKILSKGKVIRKYEIAQKASRYDGMNARNRALALELCNMLGIKIGITGSFNNEMDLSVGEGKELYKEEMMLNKAGDWIASRANASDMVRSINDYLRISGRYETTKETI